MVFVHGDFGDGFDSWGPACALIGDAVAQSSSIGRVWGGFAGGHSLHDRGEARALLDVVAPWASRRFISSGTPMAP